MTFLALMNLVKSSYPDADPFETCADMHGLKPDAHLCGDTLVYAMTSNLWANFDENPSDSEQLETAIATLTLLTEDLQDVCHGLRHALQAGASTAKA